MGQQYQDTGWFMMLLTLLMVGFVLFNIFRAQRGKDLYIRRIAGLDAIDEAVGRATELGRPVIMVPGIEDPIGAKTMQAINIFAYVARVAARFANPILVCCASASTFTVAQEVIRDVYQQEGLMDQYDVDSVRFITDKQFAFAAGVSGLILREKAAATFFMGAFFAESLILAETANSVGAIQVASSTELTQTPFFIAACDYVLIGDEYYAASAFLTRQPVLVGSLIGQDWCKLAIISMVILGVIGNTVEQRGLTTRSHKAGKPVDLPTPRFVLPSDTFASRLLKADPEKDVKIDRPQLAKDDMPSGGAGGGDK